MASGIGAWLAAIGMDKYVESFEENELTPEDLPDLTDADLKELGVTAMGHRKAISRAISALTSSEPAVVETPAPPADPQPVAPEATAVEAPSSTRGAERRQLTVMFCDLVASTEMAGRLDPEDMREAITVYQDCVTRHVLQIEGHVAKYMGDGVLCYFGWPQAHEDDAERAARSALNIIQSLENEKAPSGEKLEARIGIATGLVIVGDLVGEGAAQEEAVIGETPNLAARLQGVAKPGQVVVSDTTRDLLSNALEVEHIGQQELKGISRPVDAYAIVGERVGQDTQLRGRSSSGQLVGRDAELTLLKDRWNRAEEGEGQVFVLSGEAGIGKSQISAALIGSLQDRPHKLLQLQCSPYYSSTAYFPLIGLVEYLAGIDRSTSEEAKLDKLEVLIEGADGTSETTPALLAAMLSLPTDRYPPLGLEPLKQKEQTIAALVQLVVSLSQSDPVLLLFEDVHWCDATSMEFLSLLVQKVESHSILANITHRPEFSVPWPASGHITRYHLNRLSKRDGTAIIDTFTDGMKLPAILVEQIIEKADGIPLFVEELTRTVLDAGFLEERNGAYFIDGPLPPFAVPSSLQDSLMARLDRLSPLKDVAQTAACIGREFSFEMLLEVSSQSSEQLTGSLSELTENELITAQGTPPEATYLFRHALVQDAAYSSLLKSRRQQLHAKIAQVLVDKFPDQIEQQPEIVAQHLTSAGLHEESVPHWLSAGLMAISKSAMEEAIVHFNQGLNCLSSVDESGGRDEQELLLRAMLGVAQFTARGYGSPELGNNYEKALGLARRVGDTPYKSPAMFGVWAYHLMRVDHARATEVALEARKQAQESGLAHEMTAALAAATTTSIFKGEAALGIQYSEESWKNYDTSSHGDLVSLYGQDVGLWCADFGSWGVWLDGRSDESDKRYGEANRLAEELGHPLSLASGLVHASLLYSMAQDVQRTLDYAERTIVVCEEVGIPARLVEAFIMKGWALSELGDIDEGIALTQLGMDGWRGAGAEIARPWWLALQAHQYRRKGDYQHAMAGLDEAFSTISVSGENLWLPELNRLKGDLLLDIDSQRKDEAEAHYRQAMKIANDQVSRFWELRAATSLAELLHGNGSSEQIQQTVSPLHDAFDEGKNTHDLVKAGELLAAL